MTVRMLRWPQLAIRCPHCRAAPGEMCAGRLGTGVVRRKSTHPGRRTAWAVAVTPCPAYGCQVAPGQPCRDTNGRALADVHPERDQAAESTLREPP